MSTNHKPEIPEGSEAIWDRLKLIPFNQRFDGRKADKRLPQKLREELSGVLLWAVQGCVDWYQNGLGSAPAVDQATSAYRTETDMLERFFSDECVFHPKAEVSKTALFKAWERWCLNEGEEPGKQVGFTRNVGEKGVLKNFGEARWSDGTRIWRGIGLQHPPLNPDSDEVVRAQKSWKQGGVEEESRQLSEDSRDFSPNRTRVDSFPKTDLKLSELSELSDEGVNTPPSVDRGRGDVGVHPGKGE
jgi:putative DNA primase/helicase